MRTSGSWAHMLENRLEHALDCRARRRSVLFADRRRPVLWRRTLGLLHVGAAGELELQGLDAFAWTPIGARDPAALEAPIDDGRLPARGQHGADRLAQSGVAACAGVRAQIEHGQLAIEQARND